MAFFNEFLRPVFLACRMQHILDLHSKFAPSSHQMWKYGRHSICNRREYEV